MLKLPILGYGGAALPKVRTLSGEVAYTPEGRAVLAEFSAKLYDTDAIKRLKVD